MQDASGGGSAAGRKGATAPALRQEGNEHFKAGRFQDAIGCYRQALALLPVSSAEEAAESGGLEQAVQLNIVSCLLRLGTGYDEAVSLCDEVLVADPTSAKALFRRGSARKELARAEQVPGQKKQVLQSARVDLVSAARLEPSDRQIRSLLDEVTEALAALPAPSKGGRGFFGGLYDDRKPEPPPPPPVICANCGRPGHANCGRQCWVAQRAAWLGVSEEEAGLEPESFEEDGSLLPARAAAIAAAGGRCGSLSDMSDGEREALEDCLDSTERPYPQPLKRLPLGQAVRCAEEVWAEDD